MKSIVTVIVILTLAAVVVIAYSAKQVGTTEASCKAIGGLPVHDHDGYRCLKNGRMVDPNDEASP